MTRCIKEQEGMRVCKNCDWFRQATALRKPECLFVIHHISISPITGERNVWYQNCENVNTKGKCLYYQSKTVPTEFSRWEWWLQRFLIPFHMKRLECAGIQLRRNDEPTKAETNRRNQRTR